MTTERDALKLALEALEKVSTRSVIMGSTGDYREGQLDALSSVSQDVAPAITAIKEALAQPKESTNIERHEANIQKFLGAPQQSAQEPVAWRAPNWGHGDDEWVYRDFDDPVLIADGKPSPNNEALYTAPPQRTFVGLAAEEVEKIWQSVEASDFHDCVQPFAQALENKLKEKNA